MDYDRMSYPSDCIQILNVEEEEEEIVDLEDTIKDVKMGPIIYAQEKEQNKQNCIDNSSAGVVISKNELHYTNPGTMVDIREALQEQEGRENKERQTNHIWPNTFPPRIDESGYGDTKNCGALRIWIQLFFFSYSGAGFILIHGLAALMSFIIAANKKKGPTIYPLIYMNIVCFMISFLVMFYVKKKVHGTKHNLSLTLLLRYYNFAAFCMLVLWAILVLWNKKLINPTIGWVLFSVSLFVVVVLSITLAAWPGTIRERFMRFFFMWPLQTDDNEIQPTKLLQILWITRQIFQIVVITITMIVTSKVVFDADGKKTNNDYDASLRYHAIHAFFQAGFCEEYFKFMLVAGVPFIPKYAKSKSAILHVCIVVGMAFGVIEDIMYASQTGWKAFNRPIGWAMHFMFAYPAAWMLTRQRDSILWIFELLLGFTIGVALHGGWDYMIFLKEDHGNLSWLGYILLPMSFITCCGGCGICCSPQTLPRDERKVNRRIELTTNTHAVHPNMVQA